MTKRSKRILWALGIVGMLVVVAFVATSVVLSSVIRSRLQKMVATHLNAELRMGSVRYRFPYGVTVADASLVSHGPDGARVELFKMSRLELRLAKLPVGAGPLVIERLILTDPALHLIRTEQGIIGGHGLVRPPSAESDGERMVSAAEKLHDKKLSEMFRLRQFAINNGQVVYEDRTQPGAPPMVWKDLAIDLNTEPHTGAVYDYNIAVKNPPLADVTVAGTMDIDELVLVVKNLGLKLEVAPDRGPSPLPGNVQELLRDHRIAGVLQISGSARMPLRSPWQTEYDAQVKLDRATAGLPEGKELLQHVMLAVQVTSHAPADLLSTGPAKTSAAAEPAAVGTVKGMPAALAPAVHSGAPTSRPAVSPPTFVKIERIEAGTGDTTLLVERGSLLLDPEEGTWRARDLLGTLTIGKDYSALPPAVQRVFEKIHAHGRLELTAAANGPVRQKPGVRAADSIKYEMLAQARDASIHIPYFPVSHEKLTGILHLSPGLLRLENVEARYGTDRWFVSAMRIPLNDPDHDLRLQEIDGSIDFAADSPHYPDVLGKVLDVIHPGGVYQISGWYVVKDKAPKGEKSDFQFDVASDHGKLSPTTRRLPLTDVRTELTVKSDHLEVRRLETAAMGGRFLGSGRVQWAKEKPVTYDAKVQIAGMDMKEFADKWADGGQPMRLSGKGNLTAAVDGTGPSEGWTALDNFTAKGEFEVIEGEFWEIPVLKDVIGRTKVGKDALTVGQAAGTFILARQQVAFDPLVVSAPVLGVQGSGWVAFDGRVEAKVVAAPLADWRERLKSTGVPILSDAAGELVGAIQKLINTATSNLLYEFRVTGTVGKPKLDTVPAPALSDVGAALFGKMLNPSKDQRLLDLIEARQKTVKKK